MHNSGCNCPRLFYFNLVLLFLKKIYFPHDALMASFVRSFIVVDKHIKA